MSEPADASGKSGLVHHYSVGHMGHSGLQGKPSCIRDQCSCARLKAEGASETRGEAKGPGLPPKASVGGVGGHDRGPQIVEHLLALQVDDEGALAVRDLEHAVGGALPFQRPLRPSRGAACNAPFEVQEPPASRACRVLSGTPGWGGGGGRDSVCRKIRVYDFCRDKTRAMS